MTRREKFAAYGAWAAVCVFWGTTYLAIRVGLVSFPPMLFASMRFVMAGTVLFLVMSRLRRARLPVGREWLNIAVVALALLGVGNGGVVWAEQWISSGTAALLVATSPFWVAGLERLRRNGERVGGRAVVGMLLGFAGLTLLVAPDLLSASLNWKYVLGIVVIQLGCLSWTAGSIYAKQHETGVSPMMSAALQMLIAGAALGILGTAMGEWGALRFSAPAVGALLYLVVFGSIVAYGAYTYAIEKLPLSIVSTYSYINPVIAVLLGWAVLSEPLSWRVAVGATIILVGVALVKTSPKELLTAITRRWRRGSPATHQEVAPHVTQSC